MRSTLRIMTKCGKSLTHSPLAGISLDSGSIPVAHSIDSPVFGKLCSGVGSATGLENRVLLTGMGFDSSTFRHSFLVFAPIAQLYQSTCLRSMGSHVRIVSDVLSA